MYAVIQQEYQQKKQKQRCFLRRNTSYQQNCLMCFVGGTSNHWQQQKRKNSLILPSHKKQLWIKLSWRIVENKKLPVLWTSTDMQISPFEKKQWYPCWTAIGNTDWIKKDGIGKPSAFHGRSKKINSTSIRELLLKSKGNPSEMHWETNGLL